MSHNSIVIYKSKTGFTERFAKWIGEELSCDVIPYARRSAINFDAYDTVIYGGGIYAGSIGGLKWFKEKLPAMTPLLLTFQHRAGVSPYTSPFGFA